MKKSLCAILCVVFLSESVFLLCSCGDENEEEIVFGEDIVYVSMGSETEKLLEETVRSYLTALSEQDHISIMLNTTEDFIWNYDETAFYDYSRYISDISVENIDKEHIMCRENEYTVPVSYTLTYTKDHVDENGKNQKAGKYEYSRNFIIVYKEDRYLISDITERVMG